jgi:hypothetical protein
MFTTCGVTCTSRHFEKSEISQQPRGESKSQLFSLIPASISIRAAMPFPHSLDEALSYSSISLSN